MNTWHLKKEASARTRMHPWIYNSEIANSVKESGPGEIVRLEDARGHFVAFGYVNAKSQIVLRKLSVNAKEEDVGSVAFLRRKLESARRMRQEAGWGGESHRWVFAESDGLPGLIVDYFVTPNEPVLVVQSSTAGMDALFPAVLQALHECMGEAPYRLIDASVSSSRKLEGLVPRERKVLVGATEGLTSQKIRLRDGASGGFFVQTDFLGGQKTGFFLDQQFNATLLRSLIRNKFPAGATVRVLDICCYVGQWSSHVAHLGREREWRVEAHLVDASEKALALAKANVEALGARAEVFCADVLESLPEGEFDLVICDPPAFVKKKADIERGGMAYQKLFKEAIRRSRVGGTFVASSCSGLVDAELWQSILASSLTRAGRTVRWQAEGGHGPDHPVRSEFREGRYLKCNIGTVDYP